MKQVGRSRDVIVALAGGVGAARFLDGLARVVPPETLFIVGNTGDDAEIHGVHISPDLDTVLYTLAGIANAEHGWGIQGDTFRCMERLRTLGADAWFQLGDQDLATHFYRTDELRRGKTLTLITGDLAHALGVRATIRPMCDERLRTIIQTPGGALDFQQYFVKRRARDTVTGVTFHGAKQARPAPGVLNAIGRASAIVYCPSNPIISIGPILAVPGLRKALEGRGCPAVAISPIIEGRALKGPAAHMMKTLGMEVSARGVAELYRGLVDIFVLDRLDSKLASSIEALGMRVVVADTIMSGPAQKQRLARTVLQSLDPASHRRSHKKSRIKKTATPTRVGSGFSRTGKSG